MKYVVYNYPAEGETCERCETWFDNVTEALEDAASRVNAPETVELWRQWDGFEPDDSGLVSVGAFHDSQKVGCGGVQVSEKQS